MGTTTWGAADRVEHWLATGPTASDPFVQAVEELRTGRPVVLLDLSRRRPHGFVVAAAASVSAAIVRDMLVHARGVPWLVLPDARCVALGLARLGRSDRPDGLTFYTSIEARDNVTTGVSAHDRALTMRVAAAADASRDSISTPGHVMPIGADTDGLLRRAFATDAALALGVRATESGGTAICQILDDDGEPANGDATRGYALKHSLSLVSTVDVLDAYLSDVPLVWPDGEEAVTTPVGALAARAYRDALGRRHFAVTWGDIRTAERPVLLAIHQYDPLRDLLEAGPNDRRARMARKLERLADDGVAVLLCLASSDLESADGDARSELLLAKLQAHVARAVLRDLGVELVQII
jgi:3,4-dihydroxy 2-butanone 4-phosphate synthase / GTP cyclohydrolase II